MTDTHPTSPRGAPPARSWGRRLAASAAGLLLLAGFGSAQAQLTVDPVSFDFGDQLENESSAPQVFTLTNSSGLTRTVEVPTFSALVGFNFTSLTCGPFPRGIDPAESCTFQVVFSPFGPGAVSADLEFTDNFGDPIGLLPLAGTGTAPADPNPVVVSPASLDLTPTNGDEASALVQFTNPGPGTVAFDANETYDPPTPGLTHGGSTSCRGATLGAGQSCQFEVLWNADGFRAIQTDIQLGAAGFTPAIISVRAIYNGLTANVTLNRGTTGLQQVTLSNTSGVTVSLTSLSLTGDPQFSIEPSSTCSPTTTLLAAEACVVDILFTQQSIGPASATLSFTTDALSGEPANVVVSATGVPLPPSEPLNVGATPGDASALVEWDEPLDDGGTPITGYTVTSTPASAGCSTAGLSCTVSGLSNGTPYTFTVTATNAAGTSGPSAPSSAVTPAGQPDIPAPPTGTAGNGQISLSWVAPNANGSPITGYNVRIATDAGGTYVDPAGTCGNASTVNSTATTCVASGLTNGQTYFFRVAAINAVGGYDDLSAPSDGITPAGPPSAPTITAVTALNNNAVQIDWSYGAANGADVTGVVVTASPGGATCTDAGTSCTISGLTNGQSYTFTAVTEASDQADSAPSAASAAIRASWLVPPLLSQTAQTLGSSGTSLGGLAASSCGGGSTTKFVVPYVVRLDQAGDYFFETRNISFDTVLLVYNEGGSVVGCNDDFGGTLRSRVTLSNATPGALHTIYVTHFGGARTGSFDLCSGIVGSEGACGALPSFNTASQITGTTASLLSGTRARTNESFTVNYELQTDGLIDRIDDGMRISARNASNVEVGFCVGDVAAPEEPLRAGEKSLKAPVQAKGTLPNIASGSCVLSGLKPSQNVASLVAVFEENGQFLASTSTPFAFDVARSNTTSTLTSNSPSVFGQDIVLNASFNATAPGANPVTGTARFVRQPGNVTVVEVPIVPGIEGAASTATTTITSNPDVSLSPITYNVVILDNTDFIGSNNSTVHTVNRASTTVTINSISPAAGPDIEVNETVTVSATVAAVAPGEGTPNGTVQVRGTGGDAAATTGCDISLSGGTGTCQLSFSTKGDATLVFSYVQSANFAASSNTQAVTVLGLPVTMTLTPPGAAPFFGNSYDVGYSLTGGAGNFDGAVSLSATGPSNATATCVSNSAPTNNTGVCTFAGGQSVGAYTLEGAYAGDTQDLPATDGDSLSIAQATTDLTVTTTPSSSAAGEDVLFAVELTLTNGTGALDGSIEVTATGLTNEGTPSSGCTIPVTAQASPFTANCTRAFTLFGDDQVVSAVFVPASGNFAGDSATTLHDVTSASTQTLITGFTPTNPQVGDAVTVGFDVNGGEGTYEGVINVSVNGSPVTCSPALSFDTTTGVGSCRVPALFQAPGDYSFVVAFDGTDGGNDGDSSSDATLVTVDARNTTLALSAAPAEDQQAGVDVVFTLSTAAITDGFLDGFADGNVAGGTAYVCLSSSPVCDSASALCTASLSGSGTTGAATGTCPAAFAAVGSYSFVARYVGNDNFAGSNSLPLAYTVEPRDTSILITRVSSFTSGASPATSALVGEQVTVSFDVSGGLGEYEGSVTVYADGPGPLSAICDNGSFNIETGEGSCTFSVGNGNGLEQVGTWTFMADFIPGVEGNDAFSSTGEEAAGINILQASTTLVLSSSPAPSVFGQPFTLTATVTATPPSEGYPTGDVNFFDGESNAIGVVTLAPTATPGVSTASIANLTRDVALPNGWRFVAATITNPNFAGANDFGYDHLVNRDNQTVAVTAPGSLPFVDGGSFNVSALATAVFTNAPSGQAVELSAGPAGVCSGSGSSTGGSNVSISILGGGTCVITASVPQSNNYNAVAPQTVNVEITPIDQFISFGSLPIRPAGAAPFTVSATSDSGLPVSFSSLTPGVCSVSGDQVSYVAAGVCEIAADQAGNASYNPAEQEVRDFVYIAIQIEGEPEDGTVDENYFVSFNAISDGSANLPYSYALTGQSVPGVTLNTSNGSFGGIPTTAGTYTFTITATDSSVDGPDRVDAPYSGSREFTITIAKAAQEITGFAATPASLVYLGTPATLTATGGESGEPVVFSSLTPTICSVVDDQVSPLLAGTCTVAANQAGNANYEDAPQVTLDVNVAKAEQAALTAAATPAIVPFNATSALSVTGGTTNGDVTYVVTAGETFCSITGSTLTAIAADGSCTVTATMAGDENYLPVSATVGLTTIKADQVDFAVAADPTTIAYNGTSALSTSGGNGGGAVSYAITLDTPTAGTNVCSLSGSTITATGIGTCEVTATKAADANYNVATSTVLITAIKADQTISFGANPGPLTIGGSTGNVMATATSLLTIEYGVFAGSETVCDVNPSNGGITMFTAGTCVLTADQEGNQFYNAALQVTQDVVINKAQPSIGLVGSGSPTSPGDSVTFTATVSGGFSPTGSVTFQNNGVDIAGCVNVALTGLTAQCVTTALPQGSNPVTAVYNGDLNNLTATSNTVTQVVLTGTTIVLSPGNITEARFGQTVNVGYTVSGGVAPNEGTVTVTAARPGSTVTCTAPASAGTCALTGLVTTGPVLADGYTVTAAYAGDANDGASTTAASQTLTVLRSNTNTALTIAPATSSPFGQGFTLTATVTSVAPGGGIPPGTIVFLRDGESIGEVPLVGGVATFNVAAGLPVNNYVFRAEYAQTTNYLQSFENRNYAVTAKATTTTITGASANPSALSAEVLFSYTVVANVAGTTPTGNVTLTASTGETCTATVAAGQCGLTFNTAGARTVTAAYAGDSQHAASTSAAFSQAVNQGSTAATLAISPASPAQIGQSVSFDVTVTGTPGSPLPTGTVNVVHGAGTLICSYTLPGSGCAVTFTSEQSFTNVRAEYAGDSNFTGTTSNTVASYVVEKVPTSIVFTTADSTITFGQSISIATSVSGGINGNLGLVTVTATAAGKDPVTCSAVATAGSCTLMGLEAATWTLAATYAGDADDQASSTATGITVTVNKAAQTITFGANPGPFTFGGTAGSVSATASSGLAVSYSTASAGICSVDAVSGAITIIGAGNCVVAANQAGNDNYEAAPEVTQTVVINKAAQTITFGANPGPFTFGGTAGSVSATASSGLAVSYSTASAGICSVDAVSGAITIIGAGNCVVAANQAGNDNYEAAPEVTQTVVINKAAQTITFGANPGPFTFGGTAGSVSATASSGLAVSYSTASTTVCSVDAVTGAITIIGAGNCVVAANQPGNDNYLAAPEVTQTVVINPATQQPLVVTATPNPVIAGQTSALTTTGGSGTGAVTYAVTAGGANCSVTGSTLTALAAGTCTVTATKAADANYLVQTGSVVVTVNPATVDLSIVKTGRYTLTGITWELLVSNAGPGVANGASVIDALPNTVSNGSWTCATNSGGGTCATASGTGDVDLDVNLPANSSVVITITANVIGTPAAISNTAEVVAPDGITDTNPANNTFTLNLTVALFADGFEGDSLQVNAALKSSGGVVEIDGAALEAVVDSYKSVNAARYVLGEQQLQLQVREVNGLLQVRLLQAGAKQGLSSTRWIEVWPGDAVRIDYASANGELQTRLAVGAK